MTRYIITSDAAKDIVDSLDYLASNLKSAYTRSEMRSIVHRLKTSLFEEKNTKVSDSISESIKQGQDVPSEFLVAVGEASMCWTHPERAGTFDTEQAIKVAQKLFNYVLEEYIGSCTLCAGGIYDGK